MTSRGSRRWARLFAALVVAIAIAATSPRAAEARGGFTVTGFYLAKFSGQIYYYNDAAGTTTLVSYDQWRAAGFPTPREAPVTYVKMAWAPMIVGYVDLTTIPPYPLTYDQWVSVGLPTPQLRGTIPNVSLGPVYKWATSPEVFGVLNGVASTGASVTASGKMSYADWGAWLYPAVTDDSPAGFQKLSWLPVIAKMRDVRTGAGDPISYQQWVDASFPTPQVVSRFPGDRTCRVGGGANLAYVSPVTPNGLQLTFDQWAQLGYPQPVGSC